MLDLSDPTLQLCERAVQAVLVALPILEVKALRLYVNTPISDATISLFALSPQLDTLDFCDTSMDHLSATQRQTIVFCLPRIRTVFSQTCIPDSYHRLGFKVFQWDSDEEEWAKVVDRIKRRSLQLAGSHDGVLLDRQTPHSFPQWEDDLVHALQTDDRAWLEWFLDHFSLGSNTFLPQQECPILLRAVDFDAINCVKLLLQAGAVIEEHSREYTPTFTAAQDGAVNVVPLLLQRGSNLRGEFDFNKETALSIAAHSFCTSVFGAFRLNNRLRLNSRESREITRLGQILREFDWQSFGRQEERLALTLTEDAVRLLITLVLDGTTARLSQQDRFELHKKLLIYVIIHDKTVIVRNSLHRMLLNEADYFDLISPHHIGSEHMLTRFPRQHPAVLMTEAELEQHVVRLNEELKEKPEEEVDWANYPRFFVAQYRGLHYFGKHFPSTAVLNDHITTGHLNRIAPAPAVYFMSSLTPNQGSEARESVLTQDAARLVDVFNNQAPEEAKQLQLFMSMEYDKYGKSITPDSDNPTLRTLYSMNAVGYPHYATSDFSYHALRYAAGLKQIDGLKESTKQPEYIGDGKPTNPVLGKVYIALFQPAELASHRVVHVSTTGPGPQLSRYIRPERETSITGAVREGFVFYEGQFRVPDFSVPYSTELQATFGLSRQKYEAHRSSILHSQKAALEVGSKAVNKLLDDVVKHQRSRLLRLAQTAAAEQGGHLIYCHEQGKYGLRPAPLCGVREGLFKYEDDLMNSIGKERFAQVNSSSELQ